MYNICVAVEDDHDMSVKIRKDSNVEMSRIGLVNVAAALGAPEVDGVAAPPVAPGALVPDCPAAPLEELPPVAGPLVVPPDLRIPAGVTLPEASTFEYATLPSTSLVTGVIVHEFDFMRG